MISSAYYSDLVKIINKKPDASSSSAEPRKATEENREEVFRSADKNLTKKSSFVQRSDDKQRYILDIEQNLAISIG